ncbi:hypothetical protein ABT133_31265 [Streptomyces sp. NPDC001835]|uniref:hypothetical protein n=1 Tax=unclassified Streptomyces TaxID=2593676 RepID=UPI00331E960F
MAHLGTVPGPAPRSAPLHVVGGLLICDPFAPDLPPHAVLDAAEAEGSWLPLSYGEEVARAVRGARREATLTPVAPGDPADMIVARSTAPWHPGPYQVPVARLATLLWLARWSPTRLAPELLDIEAGVLLCELADVVDGAENTARELLGRRADYLARLAPRVLDGVLPGEQWVAATLRDALMHTVELPHDAALMARLRHLADRAEAMSDLDDGPHSMDEALRRLVAQDLVYERHTGAHQDTATWRTANVDWGQVPPHTVSPREAAVRWTVHDAGPDTEIEVAVDAEESHPSSWTDDRLTFRVYLSGQPLPLAVAVLEPHAGHWRGRARLREAADPDRLHVDVYHPAWAGPPRTGADAEQAGAERNAVRDLVALRDHLARDDRQGLARWAQDVEWDTIAALERSEEVLGPDRLAGRMRGLARAARAVSRPDAESARPHDPQLNSEEWQPTLAEWARLRRWSAT